MLRECLNRCKLKYQMHFTVCSNSGCTDIAVELGIVQKKKQNTLWKRITFPWQWIFHFLIFSVLFFTATSKIRFMHFCVMYIWLKKRHDLSKNWELCMPYHRKCMIFYKIYMCLGLFVIHSTEYTHRVATLAFWRTFNHDGKMYPGWVVWVGGSRPPPFTIFTITYKVAVNAPAEMADTVYSPYFISNYPICSCGSNYL